MTDRVQNFSVGDPSVLAELELFVRFEVDGYACPTCGGGVIITHTSGGFTVKRDCLTSTSTEGAHPWR